MNFKKHIAAPTLAATLALTLVACDSAETGEGALEGDPIEAIAAADGASWADTVTVSESDGYITGNPDAPIKLIEYASHTCGGCAGFSTDASEPLKEKYISTGVVSYELRNLVRDPVDLAIATLVRCGAPESMVPLSDQAWASFQEVMTNAQAANERLAGLDGLPMDQRFVKIGQETGLIDFFAARGLSADQARSCLADTAQIEGISERSQTQAEELNINSTPTFILNGQSIGNQSWTTLEPILQKAGAR
ncbi:MAG: thioredoxin domain-containing protein [Marinomonas sp.]